ncbi:serine--tRNA ligase [Candidatus Peregrinibacteria bacterium RIFCSPLOWO2_01_FULL_48_20]|nr:MAG: serine--tRNA ligase [Candidatus Peregrinibacteria bacterium RIFCSPLOWO2_01_FULL_48_20]
MLDPKFIIQNPDTVREAARKKHVNFDVDHFIELDEKRRALQSEFDALRAEKNAANEKIQKLKGDEKKAAIENMRAQGDEEKKLAENLARIEAEWRGVLLRAPGLISPETPEGKDDTENVELYKWGELPKFDFEIKDHMALGKALDIIDMERGVKIGGSRSYFLKGDGMLLELAVLQFTLNKLVAKGFTPFLPPLLVNREAMEGTSYFPGGEEQAYALGVKRPEMEHIESDEKYLIGTSEVSVASYHADEMLREDELPKLYAGYSNCFRREAGTYGKDTHGLYRIHQFQKVEQVVLCRADMAEDKRIHEMLLKNAEEVLQDLKLPYRVVAVCGGDMGLGQYYKNDIETWMPSRKSYGETHSCSTFLDFQSRRLNIRYKDKDGKTQFVHTLNNTCIASPRILIPILEIYQNADGTVTVPEVLRPYMSGKARIEV